MPLILLACLTMYIVEYKTLYILVCCVLVCKAKSCAAATQSKYFVSLFFVNIQEQRQAVWQEWQALESELQTIAQVRHLMLVSIKEQL